jgi:hypothetical protein
VSPSGEPPDRTPEHVRRTDLEEALQQISQAHAVYLSALEELVFSYVRALRARGVRRMPAQGTLAALVVDVTGDAHSPFLLHVARWVDAGYPDEGRVARGLRASE